MHGGWTAPYRTPAGAAAVAEAQGKGFNLLLGRRTYDLWSRFWPKAPSSPIADGLNAATKYVTTQTPVRLDQGPVDDVVLIFYPVLLGRGKRFISDSADPQELAFVSTKATPSGVLISTYRHVGSLQTQPLPT